MADPKNDDILDIDTLSDEDFLKLDPSDLEEVPEVAEDETDGEDPANADESNSADDDDTSGSDDEQDPENADPAGSDDDPDPNAEDPEDPENKEEKPEDKADPDPADPAKADLTPDPKLESDAAQEDADAKKKPDPKKGADEKPAKADGGQEPEQKESKKADGDAVSPEVAMDFYNKLSAPFKADGRNVQVKSTEDAIRFMQMGVNYSRRMQEMKPIRAQNQMLVQNGLDNPDKLNFIIDVFKGKPDAIQKLLKDHAIDPVDIDTSEESKYQATNYQGDPKDLAFDDAIQTTMAAEGGRELIQDINKEWDDQSKEALRDQPSIFENILAQKTSGVYSKIKAELEYQRDLGFLTDIPFLQAYHQVGDAMQKAKVFDEPEDKAQPEVKKPLGTGTRKAAPKPKTEQPNPNVSSATPRSAAQDGGKPETDYSTMSDADFMKMAPPG